MSTPLANVAPFLLNVQTSDISLQVSYFSLHQALQMAFVFARQGNKCNILHKPSKSLTFSAQEIAQAAYDS